MGCKGTSRELQESPKGKPGHKLEGTRTSESPHRGQLPKRAVGHPDRTGASAQVVKEFTKGRRKKIGVYRTHSKGAVRRTMAKEKTVR